MISEPLIIVLEKVVYIVNGDTKKSDSVISFKINDNNNNKDLKICSKITNGKKKSTKTD